FAPREGGHLPVVTLTFALAGTANSNEYRPLASQLPGVNSKFASPALLGAGTRRSPPEPPQLNHSRCSFFRSTFARPAARAPSSGIRSRGCFPVVMRL